MDILSCLFCNPNNSINDFVANSPVYNEYNFNIRHKNFNKAFEFAEKMGDRQLQDKAFDEIFKIFLKSDYQSALKVAQKINDGNKKSHALYDLCELSISEKLPSIKSIEKAYKVAKMIPEESLLKELALSNVSKKYLIRGCDVDAFEIAKEIPVGATKDRTLSEIYQAILQDEKAYKFFKAYDVAREIGNKHVRSCALREIEAIIESIVEDNIQDYRELALHSAEIIPDKVLKYISKSYVWPEENLEEADLEKAYNIAVQINDSLIHDEVLCDISKAYVWQKRHVENSLENALKIAKEIKNDEKRNEAFYHIGKEYLAIYKVYRSDEKMKEKGLDAQQSFTPPKDSVFNKAMLIINMMSNADKLYYEIIKVELREVNIVNAYKYIDNIKDQTIKDLALNYIKRKTTTEMKSKVEAGVHIRYPRESFYKKTGLDFNKLKKSKITVLCNKPLRVFME